jgi:hypothetical protein
MSSEVIPNNCCCLHKHDTSNWYILVFLCINLIIGALNEIIHVS